MDDILIWGKAQDYVRRCYLEEDYPTNPYDIRDEVETAFASGAKWRINTVWHDAGEKPEDVKAQYLLRVEARGAEFFLVSGLYPNGEFSALVGVRWAKLMGWASVRDLVPGNMEGAR